MGLLCGCFRLGHPTTTSSLPKTRYVQILEAKEPPSYSSYSYSSPLPIAVSSRPRRWTTVTTTTTTTTTTVDHGADEDARLLSSPLTAIDEKQPLNHSDAMEPTPSSSPQSSVISLPSTRFTVRTTMTHETGASVASRMSQESGIGAPPSYTSRRRSGVTLASERSSLERLQQHPVLAEAWFEQFREG